MRRRGGLGGVALVVTLTAACGGALWLLGRRHAATGNAARFDPLIRRAAARHGVDPRLVRAVIVRESRFDPDARGKAAEIGLMQITAPVIEDWQRATRRTLENPGAPFDPALNVEIGTWFLARGLRQWQDHQESVVLALAQYNAGRTRAREWHRAAGRKKVLDNIPFPTTEAYIKDVLGRWHSYRSETTTDDRKTHKTPQSADRRLGESAGG